MPKRQVKATSECLTDAVTLFWRGECSVLCAKAVMHALPIFLASKPAENTAVAVAGVGKPSWSGTAYRHVFILRDGNRLFL